jgi:hypothetical protein
MKMWIKTGIIGVVLGIAIAIALGTISLGYYNPFGLARKGFIYFWGFHILVGGIFGSVVGLLIEAYREREKKVGLKYPLIGAFIFFWIRFFVILSSKKGAISFLGLIYIFLETIFRLTVIPYILAGLILGYLVGCLIVKRRENGREVGD